MFAYAAPAHHKRLDAARLLERARAGEVLIHLPATCITEARPAILMKCQPRNEADAIRQFLLRAQKEGTVPIEREVAAREVLDQFDKQVLGELKEVPNILKALRTEPGLDLFALNEKMLDRAIALAEADLALEPFDQAILAAVLGRAEELRAEGQTDLCFCEIDGHLQPWDKRGRPKDLLMKLYVEALVWVYNDFEMNTPPRPENWPTV